MVSAQVIGAVAFNKKRPQIPEWASTSSDVLTLMEHCWRHDPAERPEGFGPIVLSRSVIARVGDPRNHSPGAVDPTSSVDAKDDADTQSKWSEPASNPLRADSVNRVGDALSRSARFESRVIDTSAKFVGESYKYVAMQWQVSLDQ